MARLSRSAWLPTSLAVVCLALALVVWKQLAVEPRSESRELAAAPANTGPEADEREEMTITFAQLQDYDEIVRRPVFNKTRRPEEPSTPKVSSRQAKASTPAASNLIVLGTVISPDTTMAVFMDKKTRKIVKAVQGTSINGWEVAEIRKDGVTIRSKDQEATLMLHRPDDKKRATPKRKPARRAKGGLADARTSR